MWRSLNLIKLASTRKHGNTTMSSSSILSDKSRLSVFPIPANRKRIWEFYKMTRSLGWEPEEVRGLVKDRKDWNEKLDNNGRFFIEHVLAFFAIGDGLVISNLMDQFMSEVPSLEVQYTWGFQTQIEMVHAEVYSRLIEAYIDNPKRKTELLATTEQLPAVQRKTDWITQWMNPKNGTFGERLLAFAVVEGVLFSGSFCAIYWLKESGLMLGLCQANDLIARDEGLHTDFAVLLNEHLASSERPTTERAHAIVGSAVQVEKSFIIDAVPCALVGMNSDLMGQYIEFVADRLLVQFGHKKLFNAKNPFPFMERTGMRAKGNFFERDAAEYGKALVGWDDEDMMFTTDAAF